MIRIGISACLLHQDDQREPWNGRPLLFVEQSMATWLLSAGVRAYMIPFGAEDAEGLGPSALMEGLDGLVLQGGVDVAPTSYGQEPLREAWSGDPVRDRYELELVECCLERDIPVLGICRGLQLLNVALGGTLIQDIDTQVDGARVHRDADIYDANLHRVDFEPASRLASIYAAAGHPDGGTIASVHHQAIDTPADDLVVEARCTEDGVIEAARLAGGGDAQPTEGPWAAGVQWHPEFQDPEDRSLLPTAPLLEDFLAAVQARTTG